MSLRNRSLNSISFLLVNRLIIIVQLDEHCLKQITWIIAVPASASSERMCIRILVNPEPGPHALAQWITSACQHHLTLEENLLVTDSGHGDHEPGANSIASSPDELIERMHDQRTIVRDQAELHDPA